MPPSPPIPTTTLVATSPSISETTLTDTVLDLDLASSSHSLLPSYHHRRSID
jgi:hypothetical protein